MKTNRAFTLIELLLVSAIISLLMSVVFFKVTEAKKKAEDTHMIAQTAEVSRAIYQYKNDNNGQVPGYALVTSSGTRTILETDKTTYNQAMQPLVTGGYLPSIPYSPSGTDYSYIISSDGMSAVFASDLFFARSDSSHNSCELTGSTGSSASCTQPGSAPQFYSFAVMRIPLPARGGPTGTCSSGNLSSMYGSTPYTCLDNNSSTQALCSCSNGVVTSNNTAVTPTDMCNGVFDSTTCLPYTSSQTFTYSKAFVWNTTNYQTYLAYLAAVNTYNQSITTYNACVANQQPADTICDGSSNNDYCSCL